MAISSRATNFEAAFARLMPDCDVLEVAGRRGWRGVAGTLPLPDEGLGDLADPGGLVELPRPVVAATRYVEGNHRWIVASMSGDLGVAFVDTTADINEDPVKLLLTHPNASCAVGVDMFASEGLAAMACEDGSLLVYNVSGAEPLPLAAKAADPCGLRGGAFRPHAPQQIVTVGAEPGAQLKVWDLRSRGGEPVLVLGDSRSQPFSCMHVRDTDVYDVVCGTDGGAVVRWDLRGGRTTPTAAFKQHDSEVCAVQSLELRRVLSAGMDGKVVLGEEVPGGATAHGVMELPGPVVDLHYEPAGRRMVAAERLGAIAYCPFDERRF